jgi:hypothetical protein
MKSRALNLEEIRSGEIEDIISDFVNEQGFSTENEHGEITSMPFSQIADPRGLIVKEDGTRAIFNFELSTDGEYSQTSDIRIVTE